jgi:hypothetical protein
MKFKILLLTLLYLLQLNSARSELCPYAGDIDTHRWNIPCIDSGLLKSLDQEKINTLQDGGDLVEHKDDEEEKQNMALLKNDHKKLSSQAKGFINYLHEKTANIEITQPKDNEDNSRCVSDRIIFYDRHDDYNSEELKKLINDNDHLEDIKKKEIKISDINLIFISKEMKLGNGRCSVTWKLKYLKDDIELTIISKYNSAIPEVCEFLRLMFIRYTIQVTKYQLLNYNQQKEENLKANLEALVGVHGLTELNGFPDLSKNKSKRLKILSIAEYNIDKKLSELSKAIKFGLLTLPHNDSECKWKREQQQQEEDNYFICSNLLKGNFLIVMNFKTNKVEEICYEDVHKETFDGYQTEKVTELDINKKKYSFNSQKDPVHISNWLKFNYDKEKLSAFIANVIKDTIANDEEITKIRQTKNLGIRKKSSAKPRTDKISEKKAAILTLQKQYDIGMKLTLDRIINNYFSKDEYKSVEKINAYVASEWNPKTTNKHILLLEQFSEEVTSNFISSTTKLYSVAK